MPKRTPRDERLEAKQAAMRLRMLHRKANLASSSIRATASMAKNGHKNNG